MSTQTKTRKLTDCANLQESLKVLDEHKIHPNSAVRKLVSLAWKMTHEDDRTSTMGQAQDAMEHEEQTSAPKQKEEDKTHDNSESEINPRGGTEGSHLHGNPSGDPGSDVPEPKKSSEKDQQNAKEQTGDSQLGGQETDPYAIGQPPQELLFQKIMELMDPNNGGMSQVDAQNQANAGMKDQMGFLQEALRPWRETLIKRDNEVKALREAVTLLQEAINTEKGSIKLRMTPGPGGNSQNQETIQTSTQTVIDDPSDIQSFQKEILAEYNM